MAVPAAPGQSLQPLQFDVATVKPASEQQLMDAIRSGQRPRTGITVEKGRAEFAFQPLISLIEYAYGVPASQIAGPETLKTERFDIVAKLPVGATDEQAPRMLQALLAERFGLTVHREKKEVQIYALVVGKSGLNPKKMKPATTEEIAPEPMPGDVTQATPFGKMTRREVPGKGMVAFIPGMGTLNVSAPGSGAGEHIEMSNLTTARFVQLLSSDGDRVVVDKTNLKGSYEASFDIAMEGPPPPAPPPGGGDSGAGMASAPRINPMLSAVEQMGLKLEPQKDQVEMLVIDHIEKAPTDN
jgi:uncharacterized protein (TIGR03435 family)